LQFLEMRGLDPFDLYGWFCLADNEALAWMNEETKKEREAEQRRAQMHSVPGIKRGR
jgi:hypothetical protein